MKRILGIALSGAVAVVVLTWVLEHVMPPPYSGYLALCVVGFTITALIKRRPAQRAARWFRVYFRARARGAEDAARSRLLGRVANAELCREVERAWRGESEKARVVSGVGTLLAAEGRRLEAAALDAVYDGVRDRFVITGWAALPADFVAGLRAGLDDGEWRQLDALADTYRLFHQRFFQTPSTLGTDPAASVHDFARLLASVGNHIGANDPGDAERAYRLSLRLRPDDNLAHAGLALLLERTGRHRAAAVEATAALRALDTLAARASERVPTTEDIHPFKSPKNLREALERLVSDPA